MASEAAVVSRRRSAHFIRARRVLEALPQQAGYMPASVLLRVSVQQALGIGGGSIYVLLHVSVQQALGIGGGSIYVAKFS
jgi:hypothetical protein